MNKIHKKLRFWCYGTAQKQVTSCIASSSCVTRLRESRRERIIDVAIFGINYWWHIQWETNQKFCIACYLKDWDKRAVVIWVKFLLRSFLLACQSLGHCLIGVSEVLDFLAINIWHCIWSWCFVCHNVKTASSFLDFFEQTNKHEKIKFTLKNMASGEFLPQKTVSSCDVCGYHSRLSATFADKASTTLVLKIQLAVRLWNNVSLILYSF